MSSKRNVFQNTAGGIFILIKRKVWARLVGCHGCQRYFNCDENKIFKKICPKNNGAV